MDKKKFKPLKTQKKLENSWSDEYSALGNFSLRVYSKNYYFIIYSERSHENSSTKFQRQHFFTTSESFLPLSYNKD